jgi:hypothetical protein
MLILLIITLLYMVALQLMAAAPVNEADKKNTVRWMRIAMVPHSFVLFQCPRIQDALMNKPAKMNEGKKGEEPGSPKQRGKDEERLGQTKKRSNSCCWLNIKIQLEQKQRTKSFRHGNLF